MVDIGALWAGEESYHPLLRLGHTRVVGFEPIAEACEELNLRFGPSNVYLPYAIGNGTLQKFHICNVFNTSSLYEPDHECMGSYHNLPDFCRVEALQDVQTVRLDDVREAQGADFLKLDVQGAELDVLRGAERSLESIVAIQTEVEFVPIYKDQPLFADIDQFLRQRGFMFHRFVNVEGRVLKTLHAKHDTPAQRGQVLWADAVYIRKISLWKDLPADRLIKLAVILHELYASFDFCASLLQIHDQKTGSRYYRDYLAALRLTAADE